jgi:hypothetical protein
MATKEEPAAEEDRSSVLNVGEDAESILRPELNERLKANLKRFWDLHGTDFALHWLMKPADVQMQFLKQASPDLPENPIASGVQCKPTDLLVPEMCASVLMASQGRALIAVCQTRAMEDTDAADLELLRKLDEKKQMPIFSGIEVNGDLSKGFDAFASRLAFVHNGKIVTCDASSEEASKVETTKRIIASGKVLDANQWITRNVRQTILLTFCCGLADAYLAETGKVFGKHEASTPAHIFGSILDIKKKLHQENIEGVETLLVSPTGGKDAKEVLKEAHNSKAGEAARKGADAARKAGQSSRRKR